MQTLGKYTLIEELGRGGFGVVYKAKDMLDRFVAIKVLAATLRGDPAYLQRFQREARAAAALKHPNIVTIYDIGEEQGAHYLSMEYLEGRTLAHWLAERGSVPLEQATPIVEQIAAALDYAHQHGLVHRDVKPSNIIISDSGHATLTDFGLVRTGEVTSLTMSGIIGTPDYLSPEQAEPRPDWPQDHRMDVYALGVIVFQLTTGRLPFSAETPLALLRAHVDTQPLRPTTFQPDLPLDAEAAILKALAKHPNDRFSTAGEFAHALAEVAHRQTRLTERERQLAAWYAEATDLMRAERWVEALSKCSQILMLDPAYRDVTTRLSQATAGMSQQQERLQRWQELQAVYQHAVTLTNEQRFDEAIQAMESLIGRDADYPQAREKLIEIRKAKAAWLAERQARLDRSYQEVREALALATGKAAELLKEDPDYPDPDGALALLQLRLRQESEEQERQHQAAEEMIRRELEERRQREAAVRQQREAEAAEIAAQLRRETEAKIKHESESHQQVATTVAAPAIVRLSNKPRIQGDELILTLAPDVEMIFVRVPAGKFIMGSQAPTGFWKTMFGDNIPSGERPQHDVVLDEYYIGKYPVITAQFTAFVKAAEYTWVTSADAEDKLDHPATQVNWHDAVAFCDWVTNQTNVQVRLPTEAEWEKAARGTDGRTYPWGNDTPSNGHCNFWNMVRSTTPIDCYPLGNSPYGCVDMSGNVWEWVSDWHDEVYYASSPNRNPTGPTTGVARVLRGGASYSGADSVRAAYRYWYTPDSRNVDFGFRCALTAFS